MDIEPAQAPPTPPRVAIERVRAALHDARAVIPNFVHPTVALAIAHSSSEQTARLRLERLARVVMSTDERITDPADVWAFDWTTLTPPAAQAIDRSVRLTWPGSAATRNAMRDSVRAVIRESRSAGLLTHDQAGPLLNAIRPEKPPRDEEKQARGHVDAAVVTGVFLALAKDPSVTARRDAAIIALLYGAGLRRSEPTSLDLADLDRAHETLTVVGKGGVVRDVPLAPGTRRAVTAWLGVREDASGPLFCRISRTVPRRPVVGTRLAPNTVAQIVRRRFENTVAPHQLRRTFTGDLLDSGADLSLVVKVLGHADTNTTAGYDRRGLAARRAAVDKLSVPFVDAVTEPER